LTAFSPVEAKVVRFTVLETTSGEPCIDELEVYSAGPGRRNVAGASAGGRARASSLLPGFEIHQIEHANDERYGNSRSWISAERGKGWLELELAEATVVDGVVWGRDREGKFRDRLATAYRIDVAPAPGGPWRTVATSADRELFREAPADPSPAAAPATAGRSEGTDRVEVLRLQRARLERELNAATAAEKVYAGQFAQPPETHVLARGDPAQAREIARPGAIACIGRPFALGPPAAEAERRLALARWIAAPLQPLAARVIVNRIWQHHFGEGIVATPDDFGANGAAPSHPELLEWLAAELLRGGCSLKKLHRELLLSSAYRQSSRPSPEGLAADAQNRLLWRFSPQRLEAEAIHDAVLSVAGSLDLGMGGRGFSPFEPNDNYVRVYEPKRTFGPREWRRMVYEQRVRMQRDATFGAFDFPDGGQVCPRRARSTTPLQALSLLNSKFLTDQADILAARIAGDAGQDRAAQVRRAFALAFGREPEPDEALRGSAAGRRARPAGARSRPVQLERVPFPRLIHEPIRRAFVLRGSTAPRPAQIFGARGQRTDRDRSGVHARARRPARRGAVRAVAAFDPTDAPLAARPAPFRAKAKRALVIFCSGACSHLDTWDYKPELIRRHGQPLPGAEGLVTFQGEQGS
jgi:hypothetical protein